MKDEQNFNRSGNKRFLNKLFTKSEQLLISSSKLPDYMIWVLWSVKESAYKVVNKSTGIRLYAPLSYEVKPNNKLNDFSFNNCLPVLINNEFVPASEMMESLVFVSNQTLFARTLVTENFIYSCVSNCSSNYSLTEWSVKEVSEIKPGNQSAGAREFVKKNLAQKKNVEPSQITITAKGVTGSPLVYVNNILDDKINLSLTHDGSYLAYSYLIL